MELRGKVNQIKAAAFLHLCPRRLSLSVSGWWATMAQIPSRMLAVLLRHEGGTACGLLESVWVTPSVLGTITFTYIDY